MKKLFLIAVLIASLTMPAWGWYVRTITIFIEPAIQSASLTIFWAAMVAHGCIMVTEKATEPLANYEAGIQHSTRSTSSTVTWPDGDYPTRDYDVETVYDYDPFTRNARWFIKYTFTVINRDGTSNSTITYSQTPPLVPDWNQEDVHYKRVVMSGCHCSDFAWDSFQVLTGYCIRRGSGAWGRPVTAWFTGWNWTMLFQNDTLNHKTTTRYEYGRHCFIGPSSLGTSSMALFKLGPGEPNAEVFNIGVVTLYFSPNDLM